MKDFQKGAEELAKQIGDGTLEGVFAVDGGARTVPLEAGAWQNFMGRYGPKDIENYTPPGGPHAVQNSLEQTYAVSLEDIAKTTLEQGPGAGMERHVERMDAEFKQRAPRLTGEYADSTARFVVDDGQPVYQRYGAHYGEDPSE